MSEIPLISANLMAERDRAHNDPELLEAIHVVNIERTIEFARDGSRAEVPLLCDPIEFKTAPRQPEGAIRRSMDELYRLAHARPEEATEYQYRSNSGRTVYDVRVIPAPTFDFEEVSVYMTEVAPGNGIGFFFRAVRRANVTAH